MNKSDILDKSAKFRKLKKRKSCWGCAYLIHRHYDRGLMIAKCERKVFYGYQYKGDLQKWVCNYFRKDST